MERHFPILGMSKKETEQRIVEIERVYRDIQQMAEREQVDLDKCPTLKPNWIKHSCPGAGARSTPKTPTEGQYAERKPAPETNSEVSD